MEKTKKSLAFTLAEVLIVLGIIGIVAALTILTLMANVQKQQYVTALKKFYSTQSEGFARMLAEENVEKLEDTEAFQAIPDDDGCFLDDATGTCAPFFTALKKYFNFTVMATPSTYSMSAMNGQDNPPIESNVLALSDGSVINYAGFYKAAYTHNKTEAEIRVE